MEKRKSFLKSFLKALGAKDIVLTEILSDKVYGSVIYDLKYVEERQDFVWYMSEANVPSNDVQKLVEFLSKNKHLEIDKIITPIEKIKIDTIDQNNLQKAWDDLFNVEIKMIDDGLETDSYFIHT